MNDHRVLGTRNFNWFLTVRAGPGFTGMDVIDLESLPAASANDLDGHVIIPEKLGAAKTPVVWFLVSHTDRVRQDPLVNRRPANRLR